MPEILDVETGGVGEETACPCPDFYYDTADDTEVNVFLVGMVIVYKHLQSPCVHHIET